MFPSSVRIFYPFFFIGLKVGTFQGGGLGHFDFGEKNGNVKGVNDAHASL